MANPQNYYEILQVSQDATLPEIKIAFRRLARQYHPDLHPSLPAATEQFKEICQAYKVLSDPQLRQEYDQTIKIQFERSDPVEKVNSSEQDFQEQNTRKTQAKDYQSAIEYYSQVIQNDSSSWETFLKRAEVYYQLFKDSSVLEDCQSILRIKPNSEQAYYYLGLSRQRLGYTQSAIDAYSKAIHLDSNRPQFYQHRGLAYEELQNYVQAINDFKVAIRLSQKKRDFSQVSALQRKIESLSQKKTKNEEQWIKDIFDHTFGIFLKFILASWLILKYPQEGLLLAFMSLSKRQALIMGSLYSLIAVFIWNFLLVLPLFDRLIWGFFPFVSISLSSGLGRRLTKSYGYLAGDVFLGGFTSLLIAIIFYLNLSQTKLPEAMINMTTIALLLYTGYSLKNGYTQISNLPAKLTILLVISVLSFMVYSLILW